MTTPAQWVAGARPRTLPAAVVPVAAGTGVAIGAGHFVWWAALAALFVALVLQVGVNYANDYSDGIKGTDDGRVGPMRLVGSKAATPKAVLTAALGCFAAAAVVGLALVVATSAWWMLAFGALSILAAWFYTGGSRPYGYRALGELSVFFFFGLVAVIGTAYVQAGWTWTAVWVSVPVGLLAVALLVVNNLRDLRTDGPAGKRTLAVVLGDRRTRLLYAACLLVPFACLVPLAFSHPFAALGLLALPLAIRPVREVIGARIEGRALIQTLQQTGRLQIIFGVLFAVGLALA